MRSINKKLKFRERRFPSTRIFSSGRIPASFGKVIIGISFFLFIFALTLSSSSLFNSWLRPSANIKNLFSIQLGPAEPVPVQTFSIKFNWQDKLNIFFFKTDSNEKMEKDRATRSSKCPEAKERHLEEIMLLDQGRIINEYSGISEFSEAFVSKPGETRPLFLAMSLKERDKAFEAFEILREDQEEGKKEKTEEEEEIIKPEFKNIKERISVYAFVVWLWLVIGVLLYILNEQIKEAERRRRLGL